MGYTWDEEMREKLVEAALKYKENPQARAPLNAIIMEIQKPLKNKLDAIRAVLNKHE